MRPGHPSSRRLFRKHVRASPPLRQQDTGLDAEVLNDRINFDVCLVVTKRIFKLENGRSVRASTEYGETFRA